MNVKLLLKFFKQNKTAFFIVFLLAVAYFLIRIPDLIKQPIFADEAIYIRWSQVMRAEPTLRFLPLSDGKTPFYMWMMIPFFKIFDDPLYAGRFLSVLSGFGTFLGVLFLGWKFFNVRVGILAAALVTFIPYMLFFDRLALVDSMLAATVVWSLNIALVVVVYKRIDLAMVLGYFLGIGLLVKPPAVFSILSVPLTLLNIDWKSKDRQNTLLKTCGLFLIALIVAIGIYNILRLGPGFSNLSSRNDDYIHPFNRLLEYPLDPLKPHGMSFFRVLNSLFGVPLIIFGLFSMVLALIRKNKIAVIILLWAIIPLIAQLSLLKVFTGRYVLFTIPLILVITAWGIDVVWKGLRKKTAWLGYLLIAVLITWPLYFIYTLHFSPLEKLPLEKNERRGYLEDWTAGYGLKEIANYLHQRSKDGTVVVGTDGSFGTLSDGLQIYTDKNLKIIVIGGKATISAQLRDAAKSNETYFVYNSLLESVGFKEKTELIMTFPKITGTMLLPQAIKLYKVFPLDSETTPSAQRKDD